MLNKVNSESRFIESKFKSLEFFLSSKSFANLGVVVSWKKKFSFFRFKIFFGVLSVDALFVGKVHKNFGSESIGFIELLKFSMEENKEFKF